MYLLTKKNIVMGGMEAPCYVRNQSNGCYISSKFVDSTHILYQDNYYPVQEYRLQSVEMLPDALEFDGTWILEEGTLSQSAILKKEQENALFLASLTDLALMELSARLDDLEDNIRDSQ